jgi:hypothetical protein
MICLLKLPKFEEVNYPIYLLTLTNLLIPLAACISLLFSSLEVKSIVNGACGIPFPWRITGDHPFRTDRHCSASIRDAGCDLDRVRIQHHTLLHCAALGGVGGRRR